MNKEGLDLKGLALVLEEELFLYRKLCDLSLRKKEAVLKDNVELLAKIIGEERTLIVEAERLESKRINEIAKIAQKLGLNENIKLSDLKGFLREEEFSPLEERAKQLKAVLDELKSINETNRYLIESTLRYISYLIDSLMNSLSRVTYSKGKQGAPSFSLFQKEA